MKHLADFSRAIPNYDHTIAIEDEIVPGQKIELIKKPTSASALWVSGNRLIAITNFIPGVSYPPTFERQYVMEWLRRNPSTMDSRPHFDRGLHSSCHLQQSEAKPNAVERPCV